MARTPAALRRLCAEAFLAGVAEGTLTPQSLPLRHTIVEECLHVVLLRPSLRKADAMASVWPSATDRLDALLRHVYRWRDLEDDDTDDDLRFDLRQDSDSCPYFDPSSDDETTPRHSASDLGQLHRFTGLHLDNPDDSGSILGLDGNGSETGPESIEHSWVDRVEGSASTTDDDNGHSTSLYDFDAASGPLQHHADDAEFYEGQDRNGATDELDSDGSVVEDEGCSSHSRPLDVGHMSELAPDLNFDSQDDENADPGGDVDQYDIYEGYETNELAAQLNCDGEAGDNGDACADVDQYDFCDTQSNGCSLHADADDWSVDDFDDVSSFDDGECENLFVGE